MNEFVCSPASLTISLDALNVDSNRVFILVMKKSVHVVNNKKNVCCICSINK